ncbi:uridine 5'-monophosphate synthase-like, partial [Oreochromis aureus]|uniref:uridine 5'-monophosphate synthase-like n=1 Tax=Oreochromis aureus TaxID=47969 RepID=UPI0019538885
KTYIEAFYSETFGGRVPGGAKSASKARECGERGRRFTDSLILKLHDVNGVKFGEYKLKSGLLAPIYIDLRVLMSHPALTNQVASLIYERVQEEGLQLHSVCGAPYTALPLATVICSRHELPMVIRRKEAKTIGTKRLVEGSFRQGDTCLIIEDTVTSGTSILETAEVLCKEGLKVTDAVVLMDREQGGVEMLASKGIKLHPIISISQLLRVLQAAERIDAQTAQSVHRFIQDNNTFRYNFTEFSPQWGSSVYLCYFTIQEQKVSTVTLSPSRPGFNTTVTLDPSPRTHNNGCSKIINMFSCFHHDEEQKL